LQMPAALTPGGGPFDQVRDRTRDRSQHGAGRRRRAIKLLAKIVLILHKL
jgi:hypothetical protein